MGKKKVITYRRCYDCAFAHLIQYADDPVVSKCDYERDVQVASTVLPCRHFRPNTGEPHIEKRKKRIGITDIYI